MNYETQTLSTFYQSTKITYKNFDSFSSWWKRDARTYPPQTMMKFIEVDKTSVVCGLSLDEIKTS